MIVNTITKNSTENSVLFCRFVLKMQFACRKMQSILKSLKRGYGMLFFVKTCCEFASPYDIIIIQIKLIGVSVYDEKQDT